MCVCGVCEKDRESERGDIFSRKVYSADTVKIFQKKEISYYHFENEKIKSPTLSFACFLRSSGMNVAGLTMSLESTLYTLYAGHHDIAEEF